jgi:plastocyanin
MSAPRLAGAVSAALVLVALAAGSASAATKTVYAGPNARLSPKDLVVNDFFRRAVTIRQGDSVRYVFRGFHNVVLPRRGQRPGGLIEPDPSAPYTGVVDAAGQPFWFNGQPRLQIGATTILPQGGRTHDGTRLTSSGIALGEPRPYTVRFPRRGSYTFFCTIHPGMKGTVRVLRRGARIPSVAQDKRAAAAQLARAQRTARRLARQEIPARTISGGSDRGAVNYLRFFPRRLTVDAGQTVRFTVPSKQEPHTLSVGPRAFLEDLGENAFVPPPGGPPPPLVADGRAFLPSDPPPTLPDFDGANHGNGFISTGALGGGAAEQTSSTIRFTRAGTYDFICLIHPEEMKGQITVR